MKEKSEPEARTYEFPLIINTLLMQNPLMPQTPYSFYKQQEFMTQTNSTYKDFNVRIGSVELDLNPCEGFKIKGKIDVLDQTVVLNQKLSDFFNTLSPSNPIKQNLQHALNDYQLDPDKITLKSVKLVGPTVQAGGKFKDGIGLSAGANLGGIELLIQGEGQQNDYELTLSAMLGHNVGFVVGKPLINSKIKYDASKQTEMEVGVNGFKVKIAQLPKQQTPSPSLPAKAIMQTAAVPKASVKENRIKANPVHGPAPVKARQPGIDLASSALYKNLHSQLQTIQKSQSSDSEKVNLLLGEIGLANQAIKEQNQLAEQQRNHEKVLANYQGAIDAGRFIHQIGETTGNRTVATLGITATALAQGALGCAQIFGIGMPAVTGLAMATPIAAVGAAALCLGSLAFGLRKKSGNNKELKAFQMLTQQLSEQVMQVYHALDQKMTQGFAITFRNFEILNQNLSQGFNSVHEKLDDQFSRQVKLAIANHHDLAQRMELLLTTLLDHQEIVFHTLNRNLIGLDLKLDGLSIEGQKMNHKLDRILTELLQTSLRADDRLRQKMVGLIEDYQDNPQQKLLLKSLKAIRGQLMAARGPLKAIQANDALFDGWYQLHHFIPLFQQPAFHDFPFNYLPLVNLDWAESAFECLNQLIPALTQAGNENKALVRVETEVFTLIKQSGKATAEFLSTLSSEAFLSAFFTYYKEKLDSIRRQAAGILTSMAQFSQEHMQQYAQRLLNNSHQTHSSKNPKKEKSTELRQLLIKTVNDNSYHMTAQCANSGSELAEKVAEYNLHLTQLKQTASLLSSILKPEGPGKQSIKNKIDKLKPIHELYYKIKEIRKVNADPALAKDVTYFYLDVNTDNRFHSFSIKKEEVATLAVESAEYREHNLTSLNLMVNIAEIQLLRIELLERPTESFHQIPAFNPTKIELKTNEIDQLLTSMRQVITIAQDAKNKNLVYLLGETGTGKSTLLNRLNGSFYQEVIEMGDLVPRWDDCSEPEICEVGSNIGRSKTSIPQLVPITYKGERITYCDLPGFNGSKGHMASIGEAYAPMLINNAPVNAVRGIIWVLSALQFKTGRSKQVKKDLCSLLQIARQNQETILNSLTIVITNGSNYLTKKDVLHKLQITVEEINDLDERERTLLGMIIKQFADPDNHSLIISDLYNQESHYVSDIHESILTKSPLGHEQLDFSLYTGKQRGFKSQVDKALKQRELVLITRESKLIDLENCRRLIDFHLKQDDKLGKEQEQKQIELNGLNIKIQQLEELSSTYQKAITDIEQSKEWVKIKELKHKIAGQTHLVEVERKTFSNKTVSVKEAYTERVLTGYAQKRVDHWHIFGPYDLDNGRAQRNLAKDQGDLSALGFAIQMFGDPSHPRMKGYRYENDANQPQYTNITKYREREQTIIEPKITKEYVEKPLPPGHLLTYYIAFPAPYPVTVKEKQLKDITVKPWLTHAGYGAVICYEQGVGCSFRFELYALKKDTPKIRRELAELWRLKNALDRNIIQFNQQLKQLEEKIAQLNRNLVEVSIQSLELREQKIHFEEDCQELSKYLEENQDCFDSLKNLSVILNSNVILSADEKEKELPDNAQGVASLLTQFSPLFANNTAALPAKEDIPGLLIDSAGPEQFNAYGP